MTGFLIGATLALCVSALMAKRTRREHAAQIHTLAEALHDEIAYSVALGRKAASSTFKAAP